MAEGGHLRSGLGGGFCRYAVDRYWQIPHFEKDALRQRAPARPVRAGSPGYRRDDLFLRTVAVETAGWMLVRYAEASRMAASISSRDADSEGEEGRYLRLDAGRRRGSAVVGRSSSDCWVARYLGLDSASRISKVNGTWRFRETMRVDRGGRYRTAPESDVDRSDRSTPKDGAGRLLEERATRIPPGRDDKQLTSWNALAIRGLAIAGRAQDWSGSEERRRGRSGRSNSFTRQPAGRWVA